MTFLLSSRIFFALPIYNRELNRISGISSQGGTSLACEPAMSDRAIALAVTLEAFLLMIFTALRIVAI